VEPWAGGSFGQLVAPALAGDSNNYQALPSIPSVDNKGDARVDHYFNSKLTGFFRYSHREFNQTDNPVIPLPIGAGSSNGNVNIVNKQYAGALNHSLTPASLLEFRFGVTRSIGGKWPVQLGLPNMLDGYGISGLPTDPALAGGLNTQSSGGYTGLGRRNSTPQFQNPLVINPKVNYSKTLGNHTLKAGWEMQLIHTEVLDFSPQYGQDSYSGQFSAPTGAKSNNLYNLYNVADFLFGARSSYELTNWFVAQYRQRMSFFYLQDDWKVSRKLTLNLGARYEYATPQWEDGLHASNFDPVGLKCPRPARPQQLGAPHRTRLHPDAEDRHPHGLRRELHPLQPARWRKPPGLQSPIGHPCLHQHSEPAHLAHLRRRRGLLHLLPVHSAGLHVEPGLGGQSGARQCAVALYPARHPHRLRDELALHHSARIAHGLAA
jgi:hypothetical protein